MIYSQILDIIIAAAVIATPFIFTYVVTYLADRG